VLSFLSPFVYFFAIANHVYALLFHCFAILRLAYIAVAVLCFSTLLHAFADLLNLLYFLCVASHGNAIAMLLSAIPNCAVAEQIMSGLCNSIARMNLASPCLCRSRQISASPLPLKSLRLQALP
jgi:hypothetical protein